MFVEKKIAIYGGGPSGLYCALKLLELGHKVTLFERSSALARKFLVAGSSGLNITHSEDIKTFATRYGKDENLMLDLLKDFSPTDLQNWCESLGIETFIGTSGRVFPTQMSAAQMVKKWKEQLASFDNFTLVTNCLFNGFDKNSNPTVDNQDFQTDLHHSHIFCLGGASWKSTGSDGSWDTHFQNLGIKTVPFSPMNCGFNISWSEKFKSIIENIHLKNIALMFKNYQRKCEVMVTKYGIEGSGIYAISRELRNEIYENKKAKIVIDLRPDLSSDEVLKRIQKPRAKNSLSNHLRKVLKISKIEMNLLYEVLNKDEFSNAHKLAQTIKGLPLRLDSCTEIDESISTSGGIDMTEIDDHFQLKKKPNFFVMGEMLDWDAPTGGYLLQACFSQAHRVASYFK